MQMADEDENFNRNVVFEQKSVIIDHDSGQVKESKTDQLKKIPATPDFVMAFTRDMGYLRDLTGGASKLLFGLMQVVDRNNEITLNKARKKRISEATGISLSSIDSTLNQLKKKDVILQVERGIYQLNPYLFGKGKWKNINKMRMSIEYNFSTLEKKVEYETEYGEDEENPNLLDFDGGGAE